jgi:hypothetical protein
LVDRHFDESTFFVEEIAMITRRDFLRLSGLAGLGLTIQPYDFLRAQTVECEHFFLQLFVAGGIDNSMLFDARPLEMSKANLIQNYVNAEPIKWEGANGQWTWATPLADPLKPFKNDFSLCKGLLMAPTFDGHPQNINYFMTGNPFGGECYLPHLNVSHLPMDSIVSDLPSLAALLTLESTNAGSMVQLDYDNMKALIEKLKNSGSLSLQDPLWVHLANRYKAIAGLNSNGLFARGSAMLSGSLSAAAQLETLLQSVTLPEWEDKTTKFLPVIGELFRKRIAGTAVFSPNMELNVDCHDAQSAKTHPQVITKAVDIFVKTLSYLKATPFDDKRSLFDVTTVILGSEFSRTMKQSASPIDATGTDHNNLTNSVLLAGKGIKGGLILGGSDYNAPGEKLSGAHLKMDANKIKIMARPFDFSTYTPRTDLPEAYKYQDYFHFHSIVNTVYELFGVAKDKYRVPERDASASPVIRPLLA